MGDDSQEREFTCTTCHRKFMATWEDVELAQGHLCIGMDRGLTQHQAIEEIRKVPTEG